ncbi:hypothetical protein [Filobacillus milosensis]|uniref:hypothetical protein n=1 Tax=Filobacillus milosensis TaxID=94137 RepID=UPI00129B2A65|nr:hypothetical protein [Filobacillus milosensis]
MYFDYQEVLDQHKKEIDKINREAWKFTKNPKRYKLNKKKDFCFKLGKNWCITVRYS